MSGKTAEIARAGTDPRERYLSVFGRRTGAAREPRWLAERREAAIERFRDVGFPTTRQEEWRFTNVAPIVSTAFKLAPAGAPPGLDSARVPRRPAQAVFLNGVYQPELSSLSGLPAGVQVGSLAERLAGDGDLLEAHLSRYASNESNPFTALSTAFFQDGAFVYLPRGVAVESPIHLVFLSGPGSDPALWYARTLVVAERGASAAVVESYEAVGEGVYLTNAVSELVVGEGARLDHYRIQRESDRSYHLATTQSHQYRDSVFRSCTMAFGSALSRHDVNAVLDGTGGELTLNGLSFLSGRQHVDHHTTIEHAQPHCDSREVFNGIFDDHARGVFNGRIIVRPGAQRTDSKQTNNNVLLSEDARADSQPQLEIYADDVKCTHGATLGPLDENAVFYLKSRGLSDAESRRLLTYGFTAEILAQVRVAEVREHLDQLIRARLTVA